MTARTLTVMFTDLVGSTSAWSGLDRATADRRRGRHFALMRGALAEHGGRESKNLGDGLMAGFDSVGGAVACAGAMQRSFAAARRGGEAILGLRVGMSTGDVTSEDGDLFGVPVIAASRLCALAEAGQILLPAATRQLLGVAPAHTFHDAGVLELKGLADPVPAVALAWEEAGGKTLRVVLADDATLVREGLARLLESEGIEVVAQVGDAQGARAAIAAEQPDAVVLDIRMPPDHRVEGLEFAEELLGAGSTVGVLLLSTHLDLEYAKRLMAAAPEGGVGYLAKERVVDVEEFAAALRRVAAGGTVFDPSFSAALGRDEG